MSKLRCAFCRSGFQNTTTCSAVFEGPRGRIHLPHAAFPTIARYENRKHHGPASPYSSAKRRFKWLCIVSHKRDSGVHIYNRVLTIGCPFFTWDLLNLIGWKHWKTFQNIPKDRKRHLRSQFSDGKYLCRCLILALECSQFYEPK